MGAGNSDKALAGLYPVIKIITFGDFFIEQRIFSPSSLSQEPRYTRVSWDAWDNRGPALLLLKVLLCSEGRRASRADLIRAIWPQHEMINAAHALESAASVLRRRVLQTRPDINLLTHLRDGDETCFKLAAQHVLWVDADAFLELARLALQMESQGLNPRSVLEQAYALVHGGRFLEDDQQKKWARARRLTLNGAVHRVITKLVACYLQEKLVSQAEELLFSCLEEDPTDEDILCQLMVILVQDSRRQEALHVYEYVVDILREEHLKPASYTTALATRIRNGLRVCEQQIRYRTTVLQTFPSLQSALFVA